MTRKYYIEEKKWGGDCSTIFIWGQNAPDCRVLYRSVADIEQMGGTGCRHCNQLLRPQTNRRSTDKSHTNRLRLDGIEGTTASMLGYSCFAAGLSIIMQLQCVEVQWLSSLCIHMPVSVSVTSSPSCTAEHWRTMPSALDRPIQIERALMCLDFYAFVCQPKTTMRSQLSVD